MLTEEEVEISCQKKRHRMVVALGSDHSSGASSSSCETLATSPMYINPNTVDFFSTGSLDARGTFLEPPGKCDLWNGRRSSVPGPKKSFYPGNPCLFCLFGGHHGNAKVTYRGVLRGRGSGTSLSLVNNCAYGWLNSMA